MVSTEIGNGNGWPCNCGHTVPSHLLRCPRCQSALSLDKALTGVPTKLPEPPIDEWVKEDGIRRVYSEESLKEVMAQARKRKKRSRKRNIKWSLVISLFVTTLLLVATLVI
ncbi:MAG: hypothetical protein H7227_05165 [Actinobacteria bacterium]|nr:hypothetical protein [Actinomycetota bacterium]